jgi:tRNA-2-methylthio-N6-dimethylallyladenosine synthase
MTKSPKTYFIRTFGCQMNLSDSERIDGFLAKQGLQKLATADKADLVVINSCGIRQSAENKAYGIVFNIRSQDPETIILLTGCLGHRTDVALKMEKLGALISPIDQAIPLLCNLLRNNKESLQKNNSSPLEKFFKIEPISGSPFSASIPIMTGCDNFCAYCVVPYARGREVSRKPKEILKEIEQFSNLGFKEITLLGQNVNSYFYQDKKKNDIWDFPRLLSAAAKIKGDFWIRFLTSHPKDFSTDLLETISSEPKIAKQIHLPLQSGSTRILKSMNRKYTASHYLDIALSIKKKLPEASLTTDIIVGFPGETESDFLKTKKIMEQIKFDMAYISRYSPRPQTVAFSFSSDISEKEKVRRKAVLNQIVTKTALKNNQKLIGQELKVLIKGRKSKKIIWGETEHKKKIQLEEGQKKCLVGHFCLAKVTNVFSFGLKGKSL